MFILRHQRSCEEKLLNYAGAGLAHNKILYNQYLHISICFHLQVFKRIREQKPEVLKKVVPIQGDVTFNG